MLIQCSILMKNVAKNKQTKNYKKLDETFTAPTINALYQHHQQINRIHFIQRLINLFIFSNRSLNNDIRQSDAIYSKYEYHNRAIFLSVETKKQVIMLSEMYLFYKQLQTSFPSSHNLAHLEMDDIKRKKKMKKNV